MSDKEKHSIKKLIQHVDLDKPSANFVDKVMIKVDVIIDDEKLSDATLISLLKKNSLEMPKSDFSEKIMKKIGASDIVDYNPIISKKGWNSIVLFFVSFISYITFSKPTAIDKSSYISEFSTQFNALANGMSGSLIRNIQVPSILMMSILSLFVLLVLDTILRGKKIF